ncbi:MAG: cyclase family protein [Planctomycetota bacterium]
MRTALLLMGLLAAGCGTPEINFQPVSGVFVPGQAVLIDLSHPIGSGPPLDHEVPFARQPASTPHGGRENVLTLSDRHGTRIEAPSFLVQGQLSVDRLSAGSLVGNAVVVDVSKLAAQDPDYRLTMHDVTFWEERNGLMPGGAIVVMRSGWSQRYGRRDLNGRDLYLNADAGGVPHYPGVDPETVRALMLRGVTAIAVDTASIEGGLSTEPTGHKILMEGGHYVIENLTGLERVPVKGATLFVAPLKLSDGGAAPARVFALVPRP